MSILSDAAFVDTVLSRYSDYLIVTNERCGSWYVNPRLYPTKKSVYFKSTDGHYGQWSFNLRRHNLSILPLVVEKGGCVVVDSTRHGKHMPDSLSKTIPLWCCVLNSAIARITGNQWDTQLHTLPKLVSRQEHEQMQALIPHCVDALLVRKDNYVYTVGICVAFKALGQFNEKTLETLMDNPRFSFTFVCRGCKRL